MSAVACSWTTCFRLVRTRVADRFDIERLRAALYGIGQPPAGPGWNRSQLVDLLPDSEHLSPAAGLVGIVEREVPPVWLTRRTDCVFPHPS